jgi:hypothetical protein
LAMYASDIMTVSISLFLLAKFLSHTSDYMWNRQIVLRIICEIDIFEVWLVLLNFNSIELMLDSNMSFLQELNWKRLLSFHHIFLPLVCVEFDKETGNVICNGIKVSYKGRIQKLS